MSEEPGRDEEILDAASVPGVTGNAIITEHSTVSEPKTKFTPEDLKDRIDAKFDDIPQPYSINEWVEILSSHGAPRMVGKMGRVTIIEKVVDFFERGSKNIPVGVVIPDGAPYIEVARYRYQITFSLGNTRDASLGEFGPVVPVDAAAGIQGMHEGRVHPVNPNLKKKKPVGLVGLNDPSISPSQGDDTENAVSAGE